MSGEPSLSDCPDCGQSMSAHNVAGCVRACTWTEDDDTGAYDTACNNKHIFIEGTPAENGYRFCPYCGGALVDGATKKEESDANEYSNHA